MKILDTLLWVGVAIMVVSLLTYSVTRAQSPSPSLGPFYATHNHSDDLLGYKKSGPDWGTAADALHTYTFYPPTGYWTRILHVSGDTIAFTRYATPYCSGYLWAFHGNIPTDSFADLVYTDPTNFFWRQGSVCRGVESTITMSEDYNLLLRDNQFTSKVSVFLNETQQPIHLESSFTIIYQYERIGEIRR